MIETCVEHHWERRYGENRCKNCQMKFSYWQDVVRSYDKGDITKEEYESWLCKPHIHSSGGRANE